MSRHIVMDSSGHSVFEFDNANRADLTEARRRFDKLLAKGYVPAELLQDGSHRVPPKGDRVFKATSEEILFIPALKGG